MLREITRTLNLLITAVRSGDEQGILRLARRFILSHDSPFRSPAGCRRLPQVTGKVNPILA